MWNFKDITGQRFGKWIALKRVESDKYGCSRWLCKCDCGTIKPVSADTLKRGTSISCGCIKRKRIIELPGKKVGNLIVLKETEKDKNGHSRFLCRCDCGNEIIVLSTNLIRNHTRSCGCKKGYYITNKKTKHGMSHNSRLYRIYVKMKCRCYNSANPSYKNYGGRGIKIFDKWLDEENGFMNFYEWAINNGYQDNLSIDRIDNNGNYEPSNCRWATDFEQANNKRNNHYITYKGETHTVAEWSRIIGIGYSSMQRRLKKNFPDDLLFYKGKITPTIKKEYMKNEKSNE